MAMRLLRFTAILALVLPLVGRAGESDDGLPPPGVAVADTELAAARGTQLPSPVEAGGDTTLVSLLAGNSLRASRTGFNEIATGAFGTVQGLATVIQNSGNQVVIQNSVVLNLQVKP